MRVRLDGFDLSQAGKGPNQVGTGSHEREEPAGGSVDAAPAPPGFPGVMRRRVPATPPAPILAAPPLAAAYSTTPTFFWIGTGDSYDFSIAPQGSLTPLYSGTVTGSSFTYPASAPPLVPGQTYTWSLTGSRGLSSARARAAVVILGGSARADLARKLAAESHRRDEPRTGAEAAIMMEARVWYDALADYTMLCEHNPSPAFYRQRSALYDQLPQTYPLADADLEKAAR